MRYSKKELLWWQDHPGFEGEFWWFLENGTGQRIHEFAEDNPLVLDSHAGGEARHYSPGPIFWESLRRHPALPTLLSRIVDLDLFGPDPESKDGFQYSEAVYTKIVQQASAVMDRSVDWQRALFHLVVSHQRSWVNLPVEQQNRFRLTVGELIRFLRPDDANSLVHGSLQLIYDSNSRSSTDGNRGNENDGARSEIKPHPLGESLQFAHFLKDAEFKLIPEPLQDKTTGHEYQAEEMRYPRQRILLLERLETEIKKVGADLLVLAVKADAGRNAIETAFPSVLGDRPKDRPIKLEARILDNIAKTGEVGRKGDDARKQVNNWFEKYDLRVTLEAFQRETTVGK